MKSLEEQIEDNRIQLELDGIYEKAARGDKEMIALAIEAIGNDDDTTKALVELLDSARADSDEKNEHINDIRNAAVLLLTKKFTSCVDSYLTRIVGGEG